MGVAWVAEQLSPVLRRADQDMDTVHKDIVAELITRALDSNEEAYDTEVYLYCLRHVQGLALERDTRAERMLSECANRPKAFLETFLWRYCL